jgi:hypothetical protein
VLTKRQEQEDMKAVLKLLKDCVQERVELLHNVSGGKTGSNGENVWGQILDNNLKLFCNSYKCLRMDSSSWGKEVSLYDYICLQRVVAICPCGQREF